MTPIIDESIQLNSSYDRSYLLSLARDERLRCGINVVYIYSLVDKEINYPQEIGKTIYIGEAGRESEPTGKRFSQHISTGSAEGGDSGTVYALSRYFWQGVKLRLRVFTVETKQKRKKLENDMLKAHVKIYGSLPICQGTTGENYKTTAISQLTPEANIYEVL